MKWFRSNIKHGTRLALVALAVQFALSFGHFHGIAAQAAPSVQSEAMLSGPTYGNDRPARDADSPSAQRQPASNHDSDPQSNDACAICAVIAMANAVLFASPPLLPLPRAAELPYRATDAGFVQLSSARVAFQPRAPPIS